MAAPVVKHDVPAVDPPASNRRSTYGRRKRPPQPPPKPKPRSAGFVFRSKRSNTADFSEFADVHQTDKLLKTFFDESRQDNAGGEPDPKHTRHENFKKQIKKMLQMQPPSQQEANRPVITISSTSMVPQQTPGGRRYGQIVTPHPFDMSLNVSTYNVNKMKRASTAATEGTEKRNAPVQDNEHDLRSGMPLENGGNGPHGPKNKQHAPGVKEKSRPLDAGLKYQSNVLQEPMSKTSMQASLNDRQQKETITQIQPTAAMPKQYNDAPVIPSPRKSVLNHDLGLSRDWAERFSTSQDSKANRTTKEDNEPVSRDFATGGPGLFQRLRENRRRSRSPEKKVEQQTTVAGLSHDYTAPAFPSFRQRIEDLRASNGQIGSHVPTAPLVISQDPPAAPPSSPNEDASDTRPTLKPSPIFEHHSKPPSIVSAESTAEDVQSDASSGVVSNAQSAIFMRGQIATGHYNAANTRKPPMPGPPPSGALPSLPEGKDNMALSTPRVSESNQEMRIPGSSLGTVILPPKSPKRPEYRFLPSDCSPPKIRQPISPEKANGAAAPEKLETPSSTQVRVKRQGVSFPHPDQLPKSVSVGDLDQRQQQRNEKIAACKARDLARMRSLKATIEVVDPAVSRVTNGVEHHDGITVLPEIRDSYASDLFSARHRQQASQASIFSLSSTLQNRESSALSKTREGNVLSQRLSPIMVVAEQEPIPPIVWMPSQRSQFSNRHSTNEEVPKSRFSRDSTEESSRIFQTNGFHPNPSQPTLRSLQLPADETRPRPLSAHSMPPPSSVASRTPTPFTHSLLRAQSNRSSNRASMQEVQVSELEARLSAVEKKNVMLERAFLAVINTSAAFGGFDGGGEAYGTFGAGDILRNGKGGNGGGRSSGESAVESVYAGLEISGDVARD